MKTKTILLNGLLTGLIMLIVGILISQVLNLIIPGIAEEYANTNLFRAWDDPIMTFYFIYFFVLGIGLSWIYAVARPNVKCSGKCFCRKGEICFALKYWLAVMLPAMMITYSSFPVSFLMTLSWCITSFVQVYLGFLFLAKMNK